MLIDDTISFFRKYKADSDPGNRLYQALTSGETICIDAENIMPYVFDVMEKAEESHPDSPLLPILEKHVFDLRMPGKYTWIEHSGSVVEHPNRNSSEKRTIGQSIRFSDDIESYIDAMRDFFVESEMMEVRRQDPKYVISVMTISQSGTDIVPLPWTTILFLDADGKVIVTGSNQTLKYAFIILSGKMCSEFFGCDNDDGKDTASLCAHWSLVPTMIACSLLNVKNVVLRIQHVDQKLQKKRMKRGKSHLVRVYTLEITAPGKRAIGSAPASGFESNSRPLHLVRGHLADYRDGKGLFGKHQGVYWIPSHMRGDIDNGVIKKRYRVTTDKD